MVAGKLLLKTGVEMEYSAPIICVICQESLVAIKDVKEVVATPCGHVFHKPCLADWFRKKCPKRDSHDRLPQDEMLKGQCPVCAEPGWMKRCLKLYLNADEDEVNVLKTNVGSLTQELNEAKQKLKDAQKVMDKQARLIASHQKQFEKLEAFRTGTLRTLSTALTESQERTRKMDGAALESGAIPVKKVGRPAKPKPIVTLDPVLRVSSAVASSGSSAMAVAAVKTNIRKTIAPSAIPSSSMALRPRSTRKPQLETVTTKEGTTAVACRAVVRRIKEPSVVRTSTAAARDLTRTKRPYVSTTNSQGGKKVRE